MPDPHCRGLNLSSKNRNTIKEYERGRDSQDRAQKRLERKMETRRRKLERKEEGQAAIPLAVESTRPAQPCVTRFWEFLRNFRGPERF